ncbi:maleylpyruvate isomerase family mycothiol-dependent enzyme [Kitasatospora nipponensis]|uniref:Maleylpyruvate isomerase family mycothiol-dependent enzyme n=1 Tax=Kitasatospora nipponensis TaxID=258049 RepID=A0ABN1W9D4_9ACTN
MTAAELPDHAARPVDHRPVDHRAAVAAQTAVFVAAVEKADPTTPVPTCPGWTLADLVKHAGSVQRWFSVLLRRRSQQPPTSREVDLQLPDAPQDYPGWLAASALEAADAFAGTDPDAPMWAWGADQHARFWARRMLFETLVHRVDAELALGLEPVIDRDLAVDGLDEFLVNLPFATLFRPEVGELRGQDETIRFRCTDGPESWLVRLRPDGFALEAAGAAATGAGAADSGATGAGAADSGTVADASVQGAAADLLLLVYGRLERTAPVLATEGDQDLLTRWFTHSAF